MPVDIVNRKKFSTQKAERYIINALIYAKIANERLPPGLSGLSVIRHMRDNVKICRQLMIDNNWFIDTYLKAFFSDPDIIDDEEALQILNFARKLHYPYYSRENERKKLDSFLAIEVYKALIIRAEKSQNIDFLIKCWFGIGDIYYFLTGSLYSPNSVIAIKRALSLVEEYGGYLSLEDKNTRLCAAACYNKLAISTYNSIEAGYPEKFKAIDDALAFYNRSDVRALDPDFPWQVWIDDVNGNIYYMGVHYEFMQSIGPITQDLADRVYNFNRSYFKPEELVQLESDDDDVCSSFILKAINSTDSEKWIQCIQYLLPAYHSGKIDLQRYIKMLNFCLDAHKIFQKTSPDFMTEHNRFDMMMVISAILARHTKDPEIGTHLFNYLKKLPREVLYALPSFKNELRTVAENSLDSTNSLSYIDVLLKSTTHNHLPTYVHSMMISHLMTSFVSWFIDNYPEKLVGMCGANSVDEVHAKRSEILAETQLAGLAHDIGKIAYIQVVSVISRRLTDNEFSLIKRHPDEGEYYLEGKNFGCIPDVVRGHQKTNDGNGGYPFSFNNVASAYKFMIDICSAADSIDAATDDIGRSYQLCKTGDAVMDEIIAQSPSRYNPDIANALHDSKLREDIKHVLQVVRQECYYEAYRVFMND